MNMIAIVLFVGFALSLSEIPSHDQRNITAEPGHTVTLPCQGPGNDTIGAVMWTRSDLRKPVYYVRDGHLIEPRDQDPSYVNRTGLVDRQMKDGNLSLKLMNVSSRDEGTYECQVTIVEGNRSKAVIILHVTDPDKPAVEWKVASCICGVLIILPVLLFSIYRIYRIYSRGRMNPKSGHDDRETEKLTTQDPDGRMCRPVLTKLQMKASKLFRALF
ncbi:CD226 antigen-like [Siniperca chuatsi]|uniref:CD226 antigen-like n=1 Tax=Siniperca chuatsi TaxID=119488 RepID=UPI001CE1A1BB|nr:CD226 antigen-like [Siniperca chuatsi]